MNERGSERERLDRIQGQMNRAVPPGYVVTNNQAARVFNVWVEGGSGSRPYGTLFLKRSHEEVLKWRRPGAVMKSIVNRRIRMSERKA